MLAQKHRLLSTTALLFIIALLIMIIFVVSQSPQQESLHPAYEAAANLTTQPPWK